MAKRWTSRRVIGATVVLLAVGVIGGAVAMRVIKRADETAGGKGGPPVVLEFSQGDLARVEAQPLSRWLPVSGAVQPVRQATVKAKVSGDVRQITVREGETVPNPGAIMPRSRIPKKRACFCVK